MSPLEHNIIRKGQVNKLFKIEPKLDTKKNKEYKDAVIKNSTVYANKTTEIQLPRLYYLVSWKNYPKNQSS